MTLHITPVRLIGDIQREFNRHFPYLKLEFFRNNSFAMKENTAPQIIPPDRKVAEGQTVISDGTVEINEEMKVREIESLFKKLFSLKVQVFRKSGNVWLETTMTDNWTLLQQNNHGREISTNQVRPAPPDDYDLLRGAE